MIIIIDKFNTVNQLQDGKVAVTRPSILGGVTTHVITSPYKAVDIAAWIYGRAFGAAPMIQEKFPDMNKEDREFLLSGITPDT